MSWTDVSDSLYKVSKNVFNMFVRFYNYLQDDPLLYLGCCIVFILPLLAELIYLIADIGFPIFRLPKLSKIKFDRRVKEYDKQRIEAYSNYLSRKERIYKAQMQDKSYSYNRFLKSKESGNTKNRDNEPDINIYVDE